MKLTKKQRVCFTILFVIYLLVLAYLLFFASSYGRTQESSHGVNLKPFQEITRYWKGWQSITEELFVRNIIGNIVAFVPMGFFVSVLSKRKNWVILAIAWTYLLSMTAEFLQFLTKVGSFDLDDVILNTIGGMLGVLLFAITRRLIVTGDGEH